VFVVVVLWGALSFDFVVVVEVEVEVACIVSMPHSTLYAKRLTLVASKLLPSILHNFFGFT